MIRKILGYFFQLIGALFFLSILLFIMGLVSNLLHHYLEGAAYSVLFGGIFWGLGYLFYKAGGKLLSYERPNKKSSSFHLDSSFKRVMFIVFILSLIGIAFAFLAYGFDVDRVIRNIFERRYSITFERIFLRTCFYLFPISLFLMAFGERILSWIKNGSKTNNEGRE